MKPPVIAFRTGWHVPMGAWVMLLAWLCHGRSDAQSPYNFGNPTAEEQLYIESMNRARAYPAAEGVLLATTTDPDILNAYTQYKVNLALMQSEFSAITALPPLAPNANLTTAARGHSAWMLTNAIQDHNETNPANTPWTRITAAGYTYSAAGENVYCYARSVWHGHAGFEVDWGGSTTDGDGMQDPRLHRADIHSATYREVGVGVSLGTNGAVGPQLVTQDFGARSASPIFGTGVAYYDLNANNSYDCGEGIAGLTVNVSNTSAFCLTASGGGWTVPVADATASRSVTFSGLNINQPVSLAVTATKNAKADLKLTYTPPVITSATSADAGASHVLTFNPVGGATGYKWNRWTQASAASENCETTTAITPATSGTYAVLSTTVKQQGSGSFHLENSTGTSQSLQLNALYYGLATPGVAFQSRIGYATTSEQFKVQIKAEGSNIWQDAYSQSGTDAAGESSFTQRGATLSSMTGKAFRIRFLLDFTSGGYYPASGDIYGWFIDAITFSGIATLSNNVTESLTGSSGSFTPGVGTYLMSVAPVISTLDFPASYQTLTAYSAVLTAPAITTQPLAVTIGSGNSANFSVATSGSSPAFKWYVGNSGDTTNPVDGATASTFTTAALTTTTSYWVRASNAAGNADSITVTATVIQAPAITTQPLAVTINSGSTASFSVVVSGASPTFQWYAGNSGVITNPVSGATSNAFTTAALTTTTGFWVRVTGAGGTTDSVTATATVITPPAITTQAVAVTINSGNTASFSVVTSGTAPTFQWYVGNSGVITNPVSGATAGTFITAALTTTTNYWVRASNAAGHADSNTVTATVNLVLAIITQPASINIKSGTATALTVSATGNASLNYQWYTTAPSKKITNATAATYSVTPTKDSGYYVVVADSTGSITSNTATVSLKTEAIVTLGSLTATYNGSPKAATATTTPSGRTVTFTYDGAATAPSNAGTYAVVATVNDGTYVGSASGSLVISKAVATLTLGSLAATCDGTPKAATATTAPVSGLSVSFTYAGTATAPTAAGTYAVVGTINDTNYQGSASGNLVIAPAANTTFAAWSANLEAANALPTGTLANQPGADQDHDGRCNLIEYAFGCSPVVSNDPAPRMPHVTASPTHFILQYTRDSALTDITLTPQACSTLGAWKASGAVDAPSGFTDTAIATDGTLQTRQASIPRSSGTKCFMRVQISRP